MPKRNRADQRNHRPEHQQHRPAPQRARDPARNPEPAAQRATTVTARSTRPDGNRRKKRVEEVQDFCTDILTDGWRDVVETRVSDYITTETFRRLTKRHRRACKSLAAFAGRVLESKNRLHQLVGLAAQCIIGLLSGNWMVQVIARKLATKIPLPWDAKMVAVARGIQILGILVCLSDGNELTHCQCFIDLAIDETKERVKQILASAVDDWRELARLPAAIQQSPSRTAASGSRS